jgi:hypothetical protein
LVLAKSLVKYINNLLFFPQLYLQKKHFLQNIEGGIFPATDYQPIVAIEQSGGCVECERKNPGNDEYSIPLQREMMKQTSLNVIARNEAICASAFIMMADVNRLRISGQNYS